MSIAMHWGHGWHEGAVRGGRISEFQFSHKASANSTTTFVIFPNLLGYLLGGKLGVLIMGSWLLAIGYWLCVLWGGGRECGHGAP
jgi:biotin transporter BioY